MLLGNAAKAYSIPSLEILNHDVQCSHGSAIGQFDKEQLFYAQARGLEKKTAEQLLLKGFLAHLFTEFDNETRKNIDVALKKLL